MTDHRSRTSIGLDPVVWQPPGRPARAKRKSSERKFTVELVKLPGTTGDDVITDSAGNAWTGTSDGRILQLWPDGRACFAMADTGGRPLGLAWHPDGSLVVADCERGLLQIDLTGGTVRTLAATDEGYPYRLLNKVAVATDGTIWFTDSSMRFTMDDFKADLLEHSSTGRLFRRSPDGTIEQVASGLAFANGIALSPDESFLLVAQSANYTIDRLWLTGPRQGQWEPFLDNLPAFPDGIRVGSEGLFWVAFPSARNALLDFLSSRAPRWRKVAWAMPDPLQPRDSRTLFTQAYDSEGQLVHDLQARNPELYFCSGVAEHNGVLWLASLSCKVIGRIVL